uniref:UBC core domain-containing protein n=3 Tax=Piliocolobus tephrosceles TaxID=591936 RepID=A0A8C9HS33_9PRIM
MSYKSVKKLKPFELVLQKELMDLDEIEGIELNQINENNLEEISVSITPREGYFINKTIKFVLKFKDTYPITPPKIVCITKIFHPNVDENGNVCLNVLKLDWTPAISLQMLILGLLILLTVLLYIYIQHSSCTFFFFFFTNYIFLVFFFFFFFAYIYSS